MRKRKLTIRNYFYYLYQLARYICLRRFFAFVGVIRQMGFLDSSVINSYCLRCDGCGFDKCCGAEICDGGMMCGKLYGNAADRAKIIAERESEK